MVPSSIQFVYFYSSNPQISNSNNAKELKKSLSEVLSIYYPSPAASSATSTSNATTPESPSPRRKQTAISRKPLPIKTLNISRNLYLSKRMTFAWPFKPPISAAGINLAHKIADGLSFVSIVNTWSAVARHGSVALLKFDTATYAPPLDVLNNLQPPTGLNEEKVAARIIMFSVSEITALQKRYTAGGLRPSRFEALAASVWSMYTDIRSDPGQNCLCFAALGDGGDELMWKLRDALKAFDSAYLGRLKKREMQLLWLKPVKP
ncbi:vinorine synthase-like [Salvia hispanica]|uniref:vinorine synthase-like n=1 Tax=Salvia hispanica TaxID=49212 RepID=UPI0020094CCB|nr:vinorine synthase-like [Salvia hispanica]